MIMYEPLQQLVKKWRDEGKKQFENAPGSDRWEDGRAVGWEECADELESALSSARPESVGGVPVAVQTAPGQIWLQIGDDAELMNEPFPHDCGEELTWCQDSVLAAEVRYIRDDLVSPRSVAADVVTDAMVDAGAEAYSREPDLRGAGFLRAIRAALEAALNVKPVAADVVTDTMVEVACAAYESSEGQGHADHMRAAIEAAVNVKPAADGYVAS